MLLISPVMWLLSLVLEGVLQAVAYIVELVTFLVYAGWIGLVRAVLQVIEGVNDLFPEYDLVDSVVNRGLLMGGIGFVVGFVLMIFILLAVGLWCIPFGLGCTVVAFAFLGVCADPRRDWSLKWFPGSGTRAGPKTPLNL